MTRFARAKGSKSCNEKAPEEATSWSELKKAIVSKPSPVSIPDEPISNAEKKVKSHSQAEWAPLDNDTVESNFSLIRAHHKKRENDAGSEKINVNSENGVQKKKKKKLNSNVCDKEINVNSTNKNLKETSLNKKKKSISRADLAKVNSPSNESNQDVQKKGKKRKSNKQASEESVEAKKTKIIGTSQSELNKAVKKQKKPKQNQNVKTFNSKISKKFKEVNHSEESKSKIFNKSQSSFKPNGPKEFHKVNRNNSKNNNFKFKNDLNHNKSKFTRNNDSYNRNAVEEIIVNGEKIQIVKFQGFNVTLEDAERLKKLRADMFKEGISRDKLEAALKLERRRAEKSLSRLKKSVCFHCRGSGHVLSQCPSLTDSENTGTGICYKCGSTEHSALECKVVRGSSFQFAECFICKEQGHIARQCPDNPRGLYPRGGGCRECGDVTHFKKDCPKAVSKKSDEIVTIGLQGQGNLESLDEEVIASNKKSSEPKVVKKSVIKF